MANALLPLAVKLFWDESQPLRKLIYSKLPFAKDAAKKEFAEEQLGKLLEDSHKLAKSLSPVQADEAIDKRVALFKQDLIKGGIPKDQVDTIVERGEMFVRMLVTEPVLEVALIKARLKEVEKALESMETQLGSQAKEMDAMRDRLKRPVRDPHILALWVGLAVLLILEAVQLFILLTHAGGGH